MKITFVLVCAIALSLSFDAVNCCLRFRDFIDGQQEFIDHRERPTKTPDASDDSPEAKHIRVPRSTEFRHSHPHAPNDQSLNTNPVKEHFSPTNFSRTLLEQKNNLMADIAQVWRECNEQLNVPWSTALKFFEKSPNPIRDTNDNNEKKLVDCTLRGMGVITDKGFQAEQYLVQIRKLLLSYTPFDINQQSTETQWLVRQTIAFDLVKHFHKRENCFASNTRLIDALQFDTSNQPDNRKSIPSFLIPAICNELIQSYEKAVRECKDKKDAKGKSFKTTWMIVQCISKGNLDRMFESAFYPGMLHKAMREANKA